MKREANSLNLVVYIIHDNVFHSKTYTNLKCLFLLKLFQLEKLAAIYLSYFENSKYTEMVHFKISLYICNCKVVLHFNS